MEVEAKMQPKMDSMDQQLQFLMKNMSGAHLFSQGISAGTPQSVYAPYDPPICDPPPTRSSCHSVDTYPVTTIKSPKKCSLSVCPDGTPFVVAKGMAYPSTDGIMVHHKPLFPNCVKVWVDEVIDGGDRFNLPIPTQEFVTVADIVGNFAQWPVHLVILDENLSKEKKKMKDESCDLSATGTRPPIVDDDALKHLGDNCKYLVSLLTSVPLDKDYIDLEIDKSIFHHQNTTSIFVSMDDIKDLFTMNWLSVSIIQVFIL
nr:uncharacterized protein LOC109160468 isoform X1 [Ipomoea batatas]